MKFPMVVDVLQSWFNGVKIQETGWLVKVSNWSVPYWLNDYTNLLHSAKVMFETTRIQMKPTTDFFGEYLISTVCKCGRLFVIRSSRSLDTN